MTRTDAIVLADETLKSVRSIIGHRTDMRSIYGNLADCEDIEKEAIKRVDKLLDGLVDALLIEGSILFRIRAKFINDFGHMEQAEFQFNQTHIVKPDWLRIEEDIAEDARLGRDTRLENEARAIAHDEAVKAEADAAAFQVHVDEITPKKFGKTGKASKKAAKKAVA